MREEVPPPPREAAPSAAGGQDGWPRLREAWNAGTGRPWTPPEPPDGLAERLSEPGWLPAAFEAIGRLGACQFFVTQVTLIQFVRRGFVARVLDGHYDTPKPAKAGPAGDPPRTPPERRRYFRSESQQNMTDAEFSAWKRRMQEVAK